MSVSIPTDRTSNQPAIGFCRNKDCAVNEQQFRFPVDGSAVVCPKCGASDDGAVGLVVLIHLLTPDNEGPITGMHGRRWRLACDKDRAYLATVTNMEAATVLKEAANCPDCLAADIETKPTLIL